LDAANLFQQEQKHKNPKNNHTLLGKTATVFNFSAPLNALFVCGVV
jgi:hypothetical protein